MGEAPTFLLTVNGGSSSIKFALFQCDASLDRVVSGAMTGIGAEKAALVVSAGRERCEVPVESGLHTHRDAAPIIVKCLQPYLAGRRLAGIVHRIVHGGERFHTAVRITPEVMAGLTDIIPLAPNHLPDEIALIDAFADAKPETAQFACFDTAFHYGLPDISRTIAVPASPGLRRFGFHGLSYAFLLSELERLAGPGVAGGRVILAHLGNGASLAAVLNGQSIDTSMGLTPTGGLVMSSRAGDLDPGVVTYLGRSRHLSIDQLDDVLTNQSGLLAVSERSGDMQELLARPETDERAKLAVDIFCYQVRKWIGAFAAALGGLETLVFAGGIGEHASDIRARVCAPLGFLGVQIDTAQNAQNAAVISASGSRVTVRVISTDEAIMMARDTRALLAASVASPSS